MNPQIKAPLAALVAGLAVSTAFAQVRVAWQQTNNFVAINYDGLETPLTKVDSRGHVYLGAIAGRIEDQRIMDDYIVIKRGGNGRLVWEARFSLGGQGTLRAMEVDRAGNVYLTGSGGTVKFDAEGALAWAVPFGDPQGGWKASQDIGVDSVGSVYVVGHSLMDPTSLSTVAITTIKYDSQGKEVWTRQYSGGLIHGDPSKQHLVVDESDHLYVVGDVRAHVALSEEWAIIKYDSDGNEIWTRRYDTPGFDVPYDVLLDKAGNLLITGYDGGHITAKYDPHGNLVWEAHALEVGLVSQMALDHAGNVYVRSWHQDEEIAFHWLLKFDAAGRHEWTVDLLTPFGWGRAFAVDKNGNAYLGVPLEDSVGILKFDSDGNMVLTISLPQEASTMEVNRAAHLIVSSPGFTTKFVTRRHRLTMRSEPGHRAPAAIERPRGPGR